MKKKLFLVWFVVLLFSFSVLFITQPEKTAQNPSAGREKVIEDYCRNIDTASASAGKRLNCWQDLIEYTLHEKGLEAALEKLATLYATEPLFAKNCHDYTHIIGQTAYDKFKNDDDFLLPPQTAFCGYGFYHGFMEALLAKGGNLNEARQFCELADQKLSAKIQDSNLACFHGIGHGNVDFHDEKKQGDEQGLIDPALALCDQIAVTPDELFRCASGVFNAISIAQAGNEFGLAINKEDPFEICRRQLEKYQRGCYSDMVVVLMVMTKRDFSEAAKFVEKISPDQYALQAMKTLSSLNGRERIHENDYTSPIGDCRKLQERLRAMCLIGFADGLIEFGEPGKEYVKAVEYCRADLFSGEEENTCLVHVMNYSRVIYDPEKMKTICKEIFGENYTCSS